MASALMLLANGSEEMEAVIVIDVLRRAGIAVTIASVEKQALITGSRAVRIMADARLDTVQPEQYDVLILPGGKDGAGTFSQQAAVQHVLQSCDRNGQYIAAICAAPLALDAAGILRNRRYTCYPGVEQTITNGQHRNQIIVQHENLITSQGPGTAFEFALHLVAVLQNQKAADTLRRQMVLP